MFAHKFKIYQIIMTEEAQKQIQIARIVALGLLIGQVFFYAFIYFMIRKNALLFNEMYSRHFLYLSLPVLLILGIWGAFRLEKKRLEKFTKLKSAEQKAVLYRETTIAQVAIIQGINIFFIFTALFTFSYLPFLFFACGLMAFMFFFPSEMKYSTRWEGNNAA